MMDKDTLIEYHLANEKARYEAIKAITVAFRNICITLLLCVTVLIFAYMYFVVPVEEVEVDGNSKVVMESVVDNGSQLWQ